MQKYFLVILFCICASKVFSQTINGRIKNYYNKPLAIQTTVIIDKEYDTTWNAVTDMEGNFSINFNFETSYEGKIYLGKKIINFFSTPGDTVRIAADYNHLEHSILINNKKSLSPTTKKLMVIDASSINSFDALLPILKNKVTLIEIWATWCSPCILQQKIMEKYKAKYDSLGLNFFYISMDKLKSKEKWQRFIYANTLEGTHLLANDQLWNDIVEKKKYNAMPTYLIVDKEGNIHKFKPTYLKEREYIYPMFTRQIGDLFSTIDPFLK